MQQADQPVAFRYLLHHFHGQLVLIRRDIAGGVDRRQLMLPRRDFLMLGLGGNAQLPQLIVQILHKGLYPGFNSAKVMVVQFLPLGRFCTEKGSPGKA